MPQVATKKSPATKSKASAAPRPVLWPRIEFGECWLGGKDGPITAASAKTILGWESEADYIGRVTAGMDEKARAKLNVSFPDVGETLVGTDGRRTRVLLIDEDGQKVVCWNNPRNRPFHESHARALAQDILKRVWAGPTCFEGETINGQAGVIISKYGEVINGNHSLVGEVLADQIWNSVRQGGFWKSYWQTPPVLETLVVYGISEDPRILRTVDDTRPRDYGDVVYTSDIFAKLDAPAKRECSRMTKSAVEFLWLRTGAAKISSYTKHQTNAELDEFLGHHKKLIECVKELYDLNSPENGRPFSYMRLSTTGHLAAILYLMGASKTNVDHYASVDPPPGDKRCDWSNWDRAKAFWAELGKTKRKVDDQSDEVAWKGGKLALVAEALAALHDEGNARNAEKYAVLSLAWARWLAKDELEVKDLKLQWKKNDKGVEQLVNKADFGGIDDPTKGTDSDKVSQEEAEEIKAATPPKSAKGAALVRAPGEIAKAVPVKADAEGKPPAPKLLNQPAHKRADAKTP